ncbi:MAG: AMP-binding protein, partial [Syntrophales bacterium LBB04]|nr:AMP-binding protein [Syntrophales bacterium LBB04]
MAYEHWTGGYCLHHLFQNQVEQTPNAIALRWDGRDYTYAEINTRANKLAHYLIANNIEREMLVALATGRNPNLIIGMLAILKAGGAYLPIDAAYPRSRIEFVLKDANATLAICETNTADKISNNDCVVICIDREDDIWNEFPEKNPTLEVEGDNLAYVIYTSGSTGNPKGVQISHYNVVRLFSATIHWFGFNSSDTWTLFHSAAFDFSVWEIWGALLFGGKLVIVPFEISRSPDSFYHLLCSEKVTILNQTPAAFRQLIRAEESVGMSRDLALRKVIFGGEALDMKTLKPWFDRHGDK